MNEKLKFQFGLKCEPFRQLGEELILNGYVEMAILNANRLYTEKAPLQKTNVCY